MEDLNNKDFLLYLFYDIEDGFMSAQKLFKKAKQIRPTITYDEVKDFINKQPSREKKKYRGYNSYVADKPLEEIQLDIAEMGYLKGTKSYMLVGVDIFSKYGWAVPMDTKTADDTSEALKIILDKIGIPEMIYTDRGTEFLGATAELMNSHNIVHQTTLTHANFAERFIRTLKNMINDRVEFSKNDWTVFIEPVLKLYNKTEHRTTKMTPSEARDTKNTSKVKHSILMRSKNDRVYPEIHIGDKVRTFKKKDNYGKRKEHISFWSEEKYKVIDIYEKHGMTYYKLEGYPTSLLRHEIKISHDEF